MAPSRENQSHQNTPRNIVGPALIIVFLFLTWFAGRAGIASLLTAYAAKANNIAAADAAVRLNAGNSDSHYVRATLLESTDDLSRAVGEYYQAAVERPDDYVLWLSLARARELNGDTQGAIEAARRAVPLAPQYAQPHYQLGNILLRAGQRDEAFKELRLASLSNPELMQGIIDLAWRTSGGNAKYVEQAMAPATDGAYLALGNYFRQRKEIDAAIAMFTKAGNLAEQDRRSYVAELISEKRYQQASILWAFGRPTGVASGVMMDPGFEQESDLKDPGFGWRSGEGNQTLRLSLDAVNRKEGHSSLKVEFAGVSDPSLPVISQLVLIEPATNYQLRFAMRSEDVVSGGWPLVVVIDADSNKPVAESEPFPKATNGWRDYVLNFKSNPSTTAVRIALQRQPCGSPCPIFGRLWLDSFALHKL